MAVSLNGVPGQKASAAPGASLEMQILGPPLHLPGRWLGGSNKLSRGSWFKFKVENYWSSTTFSRSRKRSWFQGP